MLSVGTLGRTVIMLDLSHLQVMTTCVAFIDVRVRMIRSRSCLLVPIHHVAFARLTKWRVSCAPFAGAHRANVPIVGPIITRDCADALHSFSGL